MDDETPIPITQRILARLLALDVAVSSSAIPLPSASRQCAVLLSRWAREDYEAGASGQGLPTRGSDVASQRAAELAGLTHASDRIEYAVRSTEHLLARWQAEDMQSGRQRTLSSTFGAVKPEPA